MPIYDLRNGDLVELTSEEEAAYLAGLPSLEEAKIARLGELADCRWRRCQAFDYDGATDVPADSALTAVLGIVVSNQLAGITEPFTFKLKAGEFRAWDVNDVIAYGIAIRAHLQACFDREAELDAAIQAAADHDALSAIDLSSGWPA